MEKGAINRLASQTQSEQTSTSDLQTALPQPLSPGDVTGPSVGSESEQLTLTDIRDAIAECDTLRLDPSLPPHPGPDGSRTLVIFTSLGTFAKNI